MNLVVALEHRFDRTPDGAVWTQTQGAYSFWERYLDVFDGVRVVARVRDVPSAPADWNRCDGPGVQFAAVPYFVGPAGYLRRRRAIHRAVGHALSGGEAVILRVPGTLGSCAFTHLKRQARPFGVEVVGDPWDVFAPGAVHHPLRPVFRRLFSARLRCVCAHACGAAYVTREALQRRYPCRGLSTRASHETLPNLAVHYSSVALREEDIVADGGLARGRTPSRLVTVGSLEQMYKGVDTLIEAVALLRRREIPVELVVVGDGKHRRCLEDRARSAGLQKTVRFVGQVPAGEAVTRLLDSSGVFVLASRTEGLPRAMIEAMARGLPCIGTTVGGIPELLEPEDIVPPNDARALAAKIHEVVSDSARMRRMSERNLARAAEYREDVLRERRNAFYRHVRAVTEAWLNVRQEGIPCRS